MALLLAGDIGGTKTILRLAEAHPQPEYEAALATLYEVRYPSHDFPDLVPMVETFLGAAQQELGRSLTPQSACFAVAGPIVNHTSKITNVGWMLETDRLSQALSIPKVTLINDFEAVGYGILALEASDLCSLQVGVPQKKAPIAVIGAGTGLGEGYLIYSGNSYQVFGSEGGHGDFAPRSELEFQLSSYLLEKHNIERVSAERVISGQGVVAIYQFLRDRHYAPETPEVSLVVREWESQVGRTPKTVDPAATIARAALENRDRLSEKTMQMFVDSYGAEAGNFALKLLPYAGLYVAGGIAAKILPLIEEGGFLQAFIHKGRMSSILKRIPVYIVLNPQVGLIGAALCAFREASRSSLVD
ncbi:MAG: glucokinase [Leptolyngbyaceae cyanobacterium CSU_1_3]|nr:glucokinase [Leptolyngbyaceae cyanobacterium CSU_1_3]